MGEYIRRKVFIRTDANPTIAGGHVMRCLSLADALDRLGADVEFVLSDDNPIEIVRNRGYNVIVLGTDWRELAEGAEELCNLCDAAADPVVLVDTYSVTAVYVNRLAPHARVCYLGSKDGDLGPLALVANYSTEIDEDFYERTYEPYGTRLLLGAGYAPLRDCFSQKYRERRGAIKHVLVTTGNTDPYGFLSAFLRAARLEEGLRGVRFTAVVGGMVSVEIAADVEAIALEDSSVEMLRSVSDMAGLMAGCDAAVSANGTTVYELAAAGLPSVTFAMVREQEPSAESLARLGAILYCGLASEAIEDIAGKCARRLADLVADNERAAALAKRAHGLIDGLGAEKIAKEVMSL